MRKSLAIKMKEKPDKRLLIKRLLMRLMEDDGRQDETRRDGEGQAQRDGGAVVGKHVDDDDDDDDDDDEVEGESARRQRGKDQRDAHGHHRGDDDDDGENDEDDETDEDEDDGASFEVGSAASAASGLVMPGNGTSVASDLAARAGSDGVGRGGEGGDGGVGVASTGTPAATATAAVAAAAPVSARGAAATTTTATATGATASTASPSQEGEELAERGISAATMITSHELDKQSEIESDQGAGDHGSIDGSLVSSVRGLDAARMAMVDERILR